jgi:adenylate cyclase
VEAVSRYLGLLWSHRIVRIGAAYMAGGWALFQVVMNVGQTLPMPEWVAKLVLILLLLGFPPALILAWASQGRARAVKPAAGRAPAKPGEAPCIAVLPFANFSQEPTDEMFADGIVEDLITSLSLNPALRVISRSSTFAYKNRSPDVREVGQDLGARFVLEGSVRRAGDRLRVTAQLVETETGGHLWAQKYDRPVAELFDIQDDLVWEIAAALHAEIDRAEVSQAHRATSVSAWEEAMRST